MKAVHLHISADASTLACCAVAVVEGSTGVVKGLLASKSRILNRDPSLSRLELVSGRHMAANLASG